MSNIIPCITLYQPWASLVMLGFKTIETRTHNRFKSLAGKKIGIHSGLHFDHSIEAVLNPYLDIYQANIFSKDDLPMGYFLGTVDVVESRQLTDADSKAACIDCSDGDRFGLFLKNPHYYTSPEVAVKGSMGIWYFDLDTMQRVLKCEVK